MSRSAFQYDSDEVINGIIWSEILNKTKTALIIFSNINLNI